MNIRKPHRSLSLLVLLLACAWVGAAQQSGSIRASDAAPQKARSYLIVSPNTSENLTLDEALRKLNSPEETALIVDGRKAVVSIAEARGLALGTVVTVEGSVTVPSGTFKSSIADEGFAVQDSSAGIYVRMSTNLGLGVNERVRVTGKIDESNGLLAIVAAGAEGIRKRGRGPEAAVQSVSTGKVNATTEGRLVKVSGMITRAIVSDPPYGTRLFITDGTGEIQIYVSASANIDVSNLRPGQNLRVTGFSGRYKDHYEVDPRFPADISLLHWKRRAAP
jgi:uncharacterized protein YdeI (BOF family)